MPIALTSVEIECDVNENGAACLSFMVFASVQNPPFMEEAWRSVFVVLLVLGPV